MLASTWMDMVLGVDIHFEMVPTPAGPIPTPFPNPFIGVVLDPAGLAVGLAIGAALALATGGTPTGPVLINNMPATNVGTEAKGMGHILIPPGVAWVPMPKFPKPSFRGPPEFPGLPVKPEDDAISIMGSTTVTVMGSSAVRLGELWMSCGEPLRMPSSAVIAIPKGPPVLIGGPPGVNLLDALLAMVKTKWVAGYLHGLISRVKNTRLRNLLSKAACFLTGHPVDVATGRLLTDNVDFALPGPLPLKFERNYASSWSHRDSALGFGWSHSLDQALWFERGKAVLLAEDGREIEFDLFDLPDRALLPGQQVYEPINQLLLRRVRPELIEVETQTGEVLEFAQLKHATGTRHRNCWRIQRRRDRQRRELSFHYDPRGNLGWVRDAAGRAVTFEYDEQDRLSVVRLPHPSQQGFVEYVRYAYGPEGDLVQVTDALGASWSFAYERHLMVRETNRNGLSFYFAYDGWGSDAYCVRTWGDGGIYDHVITYAKGSLTVVTNSLGDATSYKLNAVGQVVELLDARGGSTKYEYDERSLKLTKLTRPDGSTTESEYDAQGNVTRIQEADGSELRLEYNSLNQPVRAKDALGGEWRWAYDNAGRILSNQNPAGERTQFHWGERDIAAVTDAAGQHTQLGYDAAGNLTTLTTPDGSVGRFSYDQLGRLIARTNVAGNVQRRYRDVLGRLVRVEEPDGNVREFTYDREGNVLVTRDRHQDVRFEYCGLNRVATRIQANTRVGFEYDTEERLRSITNEHAAIYRFVRDGVGDVLEEYGFDGLRRQYVRDLAGRVVEVKRPGARRTRYAYDARSRLLNVKYDDGTGEAFAYRADGALTAAKNDAIELSFERDALGRLLKETQGQDWVASGYDALGRRVRLDSSKGAFQRIRRDSMGRVSRVDVDVDADGATGGIPTSASAQGEATFSANFERDRFGLELERTLPGGIRARWQRDQFGRPVRHEVWRGAQIESAQQYSWDVDTRLKRVVDAMTGPVDFGHDAFGNLASAAHADGHVELRLPDALGNLFRTQERSDRRYGPGGQLLESRDARGVTRFEYDQEGNLISKIEPDGATWTYAWNAAGMLVAVTRPDGGLVELRYDALGRRISKRYRGKVTRWVWDGNVPLHEWIELHAADAEPASSDDPTGTKAVEALRARARRALLHARPAQGPPPEAPPQDPTATEVGPVTTWVFVPESYAPLAKIVERRCFSIVTDQLGAPTAMFDARGQEIWAGQLDTYGAVRNQRGDRAACPFRWPGQYEDEETGLYYNRFRYYDPGAGRYVSQDPIRLRGGPNLYAYVPDVLTHVDPWGLSGCRDVSTEPDTAFFWSGRTDGLGGQYIAAEIAQARGGTTLEMLLESRKIDMPPWDANDPAVVKAWNDVSAEYAKSVKGHVRAVIGQELRPLNVWETSELGNLMANPNVTKITTIDPKTLVEKVIFVR